MLLLFLQAEKDMVQLLGQLADSNIVNQTQMTKVGALKLKERICWPAGSVGLVCWGGCIGYYKWIGLQEHVVCTAG